MEIFGAGACPTPTPSPEPGNSDTDPEPGNSDTDTSARELRNGNGNGNGLQHPAQRQRCQASPTPTPGVAAQAVNFSTRMKVLVGGSRIEGIGGFIVTGSGPKNVIVRAIGPSLARFGITDAMADPTLELHGPTGFTTIFNNDWRTTQQAAIEATGLPPTNNLESAIVASLSPGAYTAIVRGNGNTEGVALIEVYDLNQAPRARNWGTSARAPSLTPATTSSSRALSWVTTAARTA